MTRHETIRAWRELAGAAALVIGVALLLSLIGPRTFQPPPLHADTVRVKLPAPDTGVYIPRALCRFYLTKLYESTLTPGQLYDFRRLDPGAR